MHRVFRPTELFIQRVCWVYKSSVKRVAEIWIRVPSVVGILGPYQVGIFRILRVIIIWWVVNQIELIFFSEMNHLVEISPMKNFRHRFSLSQNLIDF
jgi:hypothetical protein